jgi:nucleoside-diphosphate-sugar epimerase
MAKYLVTGAAGFIGSSLVRALLEGGAQVRGIDNFATGRRENLTEVLSRIDFREADILDLDALHEACEGVDYVLHQAAIPSVPKSLLDPVGSNRANVDGTVNVLIAARDAKVKRVVYAASSSAYGDTPTLPKYEAMTPNPISPYAVAKLASELYMVSFYRCYGLETVCLRYFNIFGPRQDPSSPYSGVLAKFSHADAERGTAHDFWRWRNQPRFHLHRQRSVGQSAGLLGPGGGVCRDAFLTAPPAGASR